VETELELDTQALLKLKINYCEYGAIRGFGEVVSCARQEYVEISFERDKSKGRETMVSTAFCLGVLMGYLIGLKVAPLVAPLLFPV